MCDTIVLPLVKALGERLTQILDSPATSQEKLPAERIKDQIIVLFFEKYVLQNQ